jgi:hypothetical protein
MTASTFQFLIEKAQLLSVKELSALVEALQALQQQARPERLPKNGAGCMPGILWMADDFNAPLSDFEEYC